MTTSNASSRRLCQDYVDRLRASCQAEMAEFRSSGTNDPAPCLELFRQAILLRNATAWEALLPVYVPFVERKILRTLAPEPDLLEDLTQQAVIRFWQFYTPEQFARARSLGEILHYWQDCAASVCLDWVRRKHRRPVVVDDPETAPAERADASAAPSEQLAKAEARRRLWQVVAAECQDDADRFISHRIFVEGFKPRDVYREAPELFENQTQVYRRIRNLKDRLKRRADVLELLEAFA